MNYIDKIMDIIKNQFLEVMSIDSNYYSQYNIILSNEQQYVKSKDRDVNNIYIVIKFVPGSLNFGQNVVPININAMGEGNKIEVCQRLLLEFAQQFNLSDPINISKEDSGDNNSYIVKQVYTQPQIMSNFTPTWNEFRSLFFMTGTFLIGKNSTPITSISYFENESDEIGSEINFINASWDFLIQLDSQAFYGTDSRTISKSKIGTLTLGINSYLTDNKLGTKIKAIAWNMKDKAPNGIKEKFYFTVAFADGSKAEKMQFSLVSCNCLQNLGEFPVISLTFTN